MSEFETFRWGFKVIFVRGAGMMTGQIVMRFLMIVTRWQAPLLPSLEQIKMIFEAEGFEPFEETFEAQTKIKDHRHPFDEIRMVVSGALLLDVAGNKLLLRSGDRIQIPSNTRHSYAVEGQEPCVCVCASRAF